MAKRPNIVIFNPDQWRGDVLGHMGNPAAVTPYLDQAVRADAVSFRWAFCQNGVCTPSRCSFMTGWYPHVAGHRTMFHMLRPHEPMLLRTLKQEGYFVWWGGKNDVVPAQNGYGPYCHVHYEPVHKPKGGEEDPSWWRGGPDSDTYYSFYMGRLRMPQDGSPYYDDDWGYVHGALEFIKRRRPKDRPFCIYLPLSFPHPTYGVEEPYYSMIDRAKIPPRIPAPTSWEGKPAMLKGIAELQGLQTWTEPRWTELRATYYGMCARVDHQFGMVLDALREAGVYDDTAVFMFADHGDFTGDYGLVEKTQNTMEDCLTRVPFVVKPPRDVPVRPRVSEALVELIDMPATVEALAGLSARHTHFGRSLVPLLAGETDEHRDAVFCEGGRRQGERHCMELQSTETQNPAGLYYPRMMQQRSEGPQHTKAAMCRTKDFKYVRRLYESDELYDLRTDPAELDNRINDPGLAGVLAQLKERMLTWYMDTCDVVPHEGDQRW